MKNSSLWTFLLVLFAAVFVSAQDDAFSASANLEITAEFPDNPFGLIVNGQKNKVVLSLTNKEAAPATVLAISGRVTLADDNDKIVRNLTARRYDVTIPAAGTENVPYHFYPEFAPKEYGLSVFIDMMIGEKLVRVVGYSGTITVSDPETSFLDPQLLFLYAVLGACTLGVAYIIREAFFGGAKKVKVKKSTEPAARPTHRDEKGNLVLDESWIPDHHLKNQSPRQSPRLKKRASNRK
ncbi:uncharacterized protein BYT42DRAFT_582207 [Radiomyces spectabilis]|uniref:uncharacterized protein n=1 Tax=Radiomyces spectabilis TaxID=64574 RepID=UPI00222010F5|nr:uncharacterized protein BYT42DRAFT_582207 [Radiomyces spectabilis]KAI8370384.1 hypothetical protein BYT42DRAFT_582207 [Radiomyces spectabilis]